MNTIMARMFFGGEDITWEVFDRNGECWAEGSAPTIEQAWESAMGYIKAEWPRSLFE